MTASNLGLGRGLVRLADPDPTWASLFAAESPRLAGALAALPARIEHCGSTSVTGLPAKPILDLLAGVPAPVDVAAIAAALAPLGYAHAPWAGVPGHEVFGKGEPRTHLLHVVPLDGAAWTRMLAFRDALRASRALRDDYARLKRSLAERFPTGRPTRRARTRSCAKCSGVAVLSG